MLCMYIENEGNYVTVVRSWGGGGGGWGWKLGGRSYCQGAGYFQNMGDLSLRGAGIFSHIIHFLWGVKCKVY